jgi:hypothetical protein
MHYVVDIIGLTGTSASNRTALQVPYTQPFPMSLLFQSISRCLVRKVVFMQNEVLNARWHFKTKTCSLFIEEKAYVQYA